MLIIKLEQKNTIIRTKFLEPSISISNVKSYLLYN